MLPTNLATAHPDDTVDPSTALHQYHHDVIHAAINTLFPAVVKPGPEWSSSDLVLQAGQLGIVSETGEMRPEDGSRVWDQLPTPFVPREAGSVNVLWAEFGLSGSTDHTGAIQAAFDAAAATGRGVHFPRQPANRPYLVGGDGILLKLAAGVSLTGDPGVIIKVKDGNGDYRSILGGTTVGTDLSGLTVAGLTFDQNQAGNPVSSVKNLYSQGAQRFCIYVGAGSGITVRDCRFTGVDSLNVVYIGGAAMKDVRVQDCDFDSIGTSPASHDHSSIYLSADGLTVTGNRLRGVLGGLGTGTAIETHGPSQIVTGNRVDGYRTGLIVTGITNLGSNGLTVSSNTVANALLGIQLWSYAGTKDGLRNVVVSDNTIDLNRDPWIVGAYDFAKGISLAPTSTDHIDNLKITGNLIRFGSSTSAALAGEYQASGIDLSTVDATRELRHFDISDNTVIGALGPGIRVQMRARRGTVARNRIVDAASSGEAAMTPFWKSGLTFLDDLVDVEVYGNRVFDTRPRHRLQQVLATAVTGNVVRCEQWDNKGVCSDGAPLAESVQTSGKLFSTRPPVAVAPRFTRSLYYGPQGGRSVGKVSRGKMTTVPFWVPNQQAWDRIGCEVTAAGAGGSVVRLGVYADDGFGRPGYLKLDAGTVRGDQVGAKERTIALSLPPGLYHLAMVGQGGTPQVRVATDSPLGGAGAGSLAGATSAAPPTGCTMAQVSGALPGSFTMTGQTSTPGVVVLRAA